MGQDQGLPDLLAEVGTEVDADRVLLHWHRNGVVVVADQWVPSDGAELWVRAGAPVAVVRRWVDEIEAGGEVRIDDVDALDESWSSERAAFRRIGVSAVLAVGLRGVNGRHGALVVHAAVPRAWSEDEVQAVRDAATRIAPLASDRSAMVSGLATSSFTTLPLPLIVLDAAGTVLAGNEAAFAVGLRDDETPVKDLGTFADLRPENADRVMAAVMPLIDGRARTGKATLSIWGHGVDVHFTRIGDGPDAEILGVLHEATDGVDTGAVDVPALLRHDGVAVAYQPVCDADGGIVGAEALCRVVDPLFESISASLLVATAEERGAIGTLDRWVLARALRERDVLAAGDDDFVVSVNLGTDTLLTGIADVVAAELAASGVSARQLQVEVTETARLHDPRALAELWHLHELGVRIALDDFGAGYASFAYLAELPLDVIKLDRSLIQAGVRGGRAGTVARGVSRLVAELGLDQIAEGIETERDLAYVREVGARSWQGFLLAPAVPPADFVALATRRRDASPVGMSRRAAHDPRGIRA